MIVKTKIWCMETTLFFNKVPNINVFYSTLGLVMGTNTKFWDWEQKLKQCSQNLGLGMGMEIGLVGCFGWIGCIVFFWVELAVVALFGVFAVLAVLSVLVVLDVLALATVLAVLSVLA